MKKTVLGMVIVLLLAATNVSADPNQNQTHPKYKWLFCDFVEFPLKWCSRNKP